MPRMTCALGMLLLTGCLSAQSSEADKTEKAAIKRVKAILVSSLDRALPKVSLKYFLEYESKGAPVHWEVNDCGEQTGTPPTDRSRDLPTCVEADFAVQRRAVSVVIAVGTVGKGASGAAELFSVIITDVDGAVHSIKQLGGLPAELHRPLPRSPRDLQPPAGVL